MGALIGLTLAHSARAHGVQRLDNGRWLDGGRFVAKTMYMVEGVLRERHDGAVDAVDVVDLGGGYVVPPFGDAHNHALADGRFEAESARFLAAGVFYVANPNSIGSLTAQARPAAARGDTVDVTYAGGGLTAPGGHPSPIYARMAGHLDGWTPERMVGEAYFAVDGAADLGRVWPNVLAGSPDFVKVYLEHGEAHAARRTDPAFAGRYGIDPALLPAVVARARAAGLRVAAHVTSAFDFRTAVAAGVDELAHMPLEPIAADDAAAAAAARVTVVTTALSHRPVPAGIDLDDLHRRNLALLRDQGVRVVLGTDGPADVVDEALHIDRWGVYDRPALLRMLTETSPRWIFPDRAVGCLADGCEGSFLVLGGDPLADLGSLRRIVARVKRGHALKVDPAAGPAPVADHLARMLMHDGAEAALAELARIEREEAERYDISEAQLNALGYAALQHGRAADAVTVFAYVAERFPASANAHDSLGDGYAAFGDRGRAIAAYRRALALDATFAPSRQKLEALLAETSEE